MTKPYRLGLYEKALPDTLTWEQKLMETHICGFDWLEISIDESQPRLDRLTMSKKERASLRNLSFQLETPISTMCLSGHRRYPLGSHDTRKRSKALEIMRRAIELAGDLGVRVIQLAGYDIYYETADDSTRGWFLENLFQCVHMAKQYGMMLGFETMETSFMDTVSKAMAYVDCVASLYPWYLPGYRESQECRSALRKRYGCRSQGRQRTYIGCPPQGNAAQRVSKSVFRRWAYGIRSLRARALQHGRKDVHGRILVHQRGNRSQSSASGFPVSDAAN